MHYTIQWLHDLRDSHSELGEAVGKQSKLDYNLLEKVLKMRTDLVESWAKRLRSPLNQFDLFILSLGLPMPENVSKVIKEEQKLTVPSWLTQDRLILLTENYSHLIVSKPDYLKSSFEDFQENSERLPFLHDLLSTSQGQVEMGMFLSKGLISKDEHVFQQALDYLVLVISMYPKFPQSIDGILVGISLSDPKRSMAVGQKVCVALKHVPELAGKISEILMDKIQDEHLVDSEDQSNGLVPSEYCIRLTMFLPVWILVLGSCLVCTLGVKSFYKQIDLLLTLPFSTNDRTLVREWLCSLINVFSVDLDNLKALKFCSIRLVQLVEIEKSISSDEILVECGTTMSKLACDINESEYRLENSIKYSIVNSEPSNTLSLNVLSLLVLDYEEESQLSNDKGKEKDPLFQMKIVYEKIVDLMDNWVKDGILFEGKYINLLFKHATFQSVALKMALSYEKKFGTFPIEKSNLSEMHGFHARLLSVKSSVEFPQIMNEYTEGELKNNLDILVKSLVSYPSGIKGFIERFPDSVWVIKASWASVVLLEDFDNLKEISDILNTAKFLIDVSIEKKENIDIQISLMKGMRTFLQKIEEKCLPRLSFSFSKETETVLSILKCLQSCTRPIQLACSSNKTIVPEISGQIPALKRTLESVLFKVKGILKENNCLSAFWMGNLKEKAAK